MTKSKKPGSAGSGRNATPPLYTEQQRKTLEFATMRRTVRTGATAEQLSNYEIMERKQYEAGVRGNSVSQRDYLRRADLAEEARRATVEADCLHWSQIKSAHRRAIDQARASGAPLPQVLPHPDDLIIDWDNGVRFLGPINEAEWKTYKQTADLRDVLYLQQVTEDALDGVPMRDRPSQGGALILAFHLNGLVAPSLRLSKAEQFWRIRELQARPKRKLLLECRKAWRKLGSMSARGQRFGTAETLLPMLRAFNDAITAYRTVTEDPLGYEEAIQTAAKAAVDFIASALSRSGPIRTAVKRAGDLS